MVKTRLLVIAHEVLFQPLDQTVRSDPSELVEMEAHYSKKFANDDAILQAEASDLSEYKWVLLTARAVASFRLHLQEFQDELTRLRAENAELRAKSQS